MKIAILTMFYGNRNWGGVLQSFALRETLKELFPGAQVDCIKYHSDTNMFYPSLRAQASQYSPIEVVRQIRKRLLKRVYVRKTRNALAQRWKLFQSFEMMINPDRLIYNDITLANAAELYDCFIVGSDQVWNPNVGLPGYFLTSIPENHKKIAYAASIARDTLSKREKEIFSRYLPRFSAISVREKSAQKLLQDIFASQICIHEALDPALLISKEKWTKLIDPKESMDQNYVLAFFFSESFAYRKQIQLFCNNRKLKLKYIAFAQNSYLSSDLKGDGEALYDVGPMEFLKLIAGSKYVFTDSFHGIVFSIIFQKQFFAFKRDRDTKVSKNSRINDLLATFDLLNRMVDSRIAVENQLAEIDYTQVEKRLQELREKSYSFLKSSLSS